MDKAQNVVKLHNRIALLEKEESKAIKRIEETRKKAYDMIQQKIEKDEFIKRIFQQKQATLQRAQEVV